MQMSAHHKAAFCNVCASNAGNFYQKVNGFDIYRCKACKLLWADGVSPDMVQAFYDKTYFNSSSKMGYSDYLSDERNHRENARYVIDTANKFRNLEGLRVLDIGCAFGFLLDEIRMMKNCEIYGIEVSNYAFEHARKLVGANIHNCELSDCRFEPESFDIVFLLGTIEHLISPRRMLEDIHKIMRPGGLLVVTTLDTAGVFPFYSLKPPEHLVYFNHSNFSRLLKKSGYNVLMRRTYFVNYHIYDVFYRLREFSSIALLGSISNLLKRYFPRLTMKIPTNEMLMIAERERLR